MSRIYPRTFISQYTKPLENLPFSSRLYFGLTSGLMFLWVAALGGGLWGQQGVAELQWQHMMFEGMCHQLPDRSFWLGGQPMAVCARCFGIYTFLLAAMGILPWFDRSSKLSKDTLKWTALAVVLMNTADVLGSILHIWENTVTTRFLLGSGIGALAILYLINKN